MTNKNSYTAIFQSIINFYSLEDIDSIKLAIDLIADLNDTSFCEAFSELIDFLEEYYR